MPLHLIVLLLTLIASDLHCGNGARILGVFPMPSISHQVIFRKLTLELNKRGHELVVLTPDPVNDTTLKNYKEIDLHFLYDSLDLGNHIDIRGKIDFVDIFKYYEALSCFHTNEVFNHPEFRKLYAPNSGENFDLILLETFVYPAFLSLAERFKAPIIGIASAGLQMSVQYDIGNPILPSHPSNWNKDMRDFGAWVPWERLDNFIKAWRHIYYYRTEFLPKHQAIAEKHMGIEIPHLGDIHKNISLIFVNQQGPISFARPNLPNIIEIGGFHVSESIKPLSMDLQKILDNATQGFIYMSLGSNVKSNMLKEETRNEFIAAFSELPYKVIWKFEDEVLPKKPDNVIAMKWLPQQAILAHPNLKVFIYQGGLQSTEEAVSRAVPLIGLPVFGDQDMNVDKMVSLGVAKKLEITAVKRDDLLEAIRTIALDKGYKQRMLTLRSLLNEKLRDSLENAIWWTEHVIRHRGAPHLHSSTSDEPWYQRQDMDIVAFISAIFVITLISSLVILYKSLIYCLNALTRNFTRSVGKDKKGN
ncbi:UDP-glycosyltransferase UGT5-like [Neodiprion pinetum]|uniref:UDP-glycosyltransferase UGT5-like n=1 Tax=Neodiprion pinetum TaxID=441929 RepID=UPI001EDFB9BE|nr:UDP-glycosyltransferase UGT5-like [Neodiprion pinetum]XP_046482377.1 UDP-glycosyltransferase UGT5-like [Neodiprion pinetum]